MENMERLQRIKNSKYFFEKLQQIKLNIKNKKEEIEKLINQFAPAEYKKDVSIKEPTKQIKNYSAEIQITKTEPKIIRLKKEIQALEKSLENYKNLILKTENPKNRYILLIVFSFDFPLQWTLKLLKIPSKKKVECILNDCFLDFSYTLENEYRQMKTKNKNYV